MTANSGAPVHGNCISCGELLEGNYCHKCGEKLVDPAHDFAITEFAEQAVDGFTHFDSKFLKTFKWLFFKPGQLTKEFIMGRRVMFMRPIQVFIIASVLFYFFMPHSSSFYISSEELQYGYEKKGFSMNNPFKYNINAEINSKATSRLYPGASNDEIKKEFGEIYNSVVNKAANKSKTFLFVILPFWAFVIYLIFYRQQKFYVPHLIFAMHIFCFFMLLDLLFLIFYFDILKLDGIKNSVHLLPFFIIVFVYIVAAIRKVYDQSIFYSIWKGLLVNFILLLLIFFYRIVITIWAVHSV